jgi:hypothetical protein
MVQLMLFTWVHAFDRAMRFFILVISFCHCLLALQSQHSLYRNNIPLHQTFLKVFQIAHLLKGKNSEKPQGLFVEAKVELGSVLLAEWGVNIVGGLY